MPTLNIVSRRRTPIINDSSSAKVTLTTELDLIGIDAEKAEDVMVSVIQENGRKYIVIEK